MNEKEKSLDTDNVYFRNICTLSYNQEESTAYSNQSKLGG